MEKVNTCIENATMFFMTNPDINNMEYDMTKCMSYKACKKWPLNWPSVSSSEPSVTTPPVTEPPSTEVTVTTVAPMLPELIPDPNLPDFNNLNYEFACGKLSLIHI